MKFPYSINPFDLSNCFLSLLLTFFMLLLRGEMKDLVFRDRLGEGEGDRRVRRERNREA